MKLMSKGEFSRLSRGGTGSSTIPGVAGLCSGRPSTKRRIVSRQAHERDSIDGRLRKLKVTPRGNANFTSCVAQVGRAEGKSHQGGPSAAGPRAHVNLDPSKMRGVASGRLYQGKERRRHRPCVWRKEAKFRGPKLLGPRPFRLHRGA